MTLRIIDANAKQFDCEAFDIGSTLENLIV